MAPALAKTRAAAHAEKQTVEIAFKDSSEKLLEYVDNPAVKSNFAISIRSVGRFYRATEDFHRRLYRRSILPSWVRRFHFFRFGAIISVPYWSETSSSSGSLSRISHTPSSRDAARTCPRKARPGFSAGLYENILSKGYPGWNEAGAGRSQSQ
jgi:hypothetical protein